MNILKMANETKIWYKSKTFWLNAGMIAVGIISSILDMSAAGVPITLFGVTGIILRTLTKEGITWKNQESNQ